MLAKLGRLRIWSLGISAVLVLHVAYWTLATAADDMGDDGSALRGDHYVIMVSWTFHIERIKRPPIKSLYSVQKSFIIFQALNSANDSICVPAGEPRWVLRPWAKTAGVQQRVPRVIHRIDKAMTPAWNPYEDSWRRLNPDWNFKIWNDHSCLEFVRQEFPEYLSTYQTLSRNIERSDFFR